MVEHVSPTRMALLAKRAQIALAEQGRDLLKEKRQALLRELQQTVQRILVSSDALEQAASEACQALIIALALEGPEALESAALAAHGQMEVQTTIVNVMGVQIPHIRKESVERPSLQRGYGLSTTSPRVDEVATRFEAVIDVLLDLTVQEVRLRRLVDEIRMTTRRVNALEEILLPRLRAERDYIQMMLEEREREMIFRLKRLQTARQRRWKGAMS
ncbi:MAG: V-type ATP synthase subunit D [Anaerolineae bacterium]